ncbi:bifunctional oligoribonuclease/PAP phosphatase NrnA [Tissierella sp. MB52-C2]|uniref:DHH family phosphoesterase n=1 Tax=Tissierella sp. MB52-C2 TaxID=3070999 RepID=UPI00280B4803|nr:bifunctional oligoribonuclease/PAP phosphatase NrnA [Tissierella sp. MB52-C2]WMM26578.1 bifunctional oligoribonuclease/PAP phosphatase NrnA [Tissierella sp. MB52-C2]
MINNIESEFDLGIDLIKNNKNIGIASHVNPDGDNLGSILALGNALEKINKKVFMFKSDDIPTNFSFLPNIDKIMDYDDTIELDLFIALDVSDENRLGKNKVFLEKIENIINIDHHISNTNFGSINIVDSNAAATGELVYKLISKMGIIIDKDIASCIYTSISSDTGSFMYDNTTSETHEIAAELIKLGIDKSNININLYQNRSIQKTKLFIKVLETLKFYHDNKVGIIQVTQDMLNNSNAKMEDTEGIISFIREIDSVEIAVLLKEIKEEDIKVSMRSKKYVDVAEICANFDGGGHIRAAGCTINQPINMAEKLILEQIKKVF